MPVERTKRLVTHLMIKQHKFSKISLIIIGDHRHPAALSLPSGPGVEIFGPTRLNDKSPDQSQCRRIATGMAHDHMASLLLIDGNVPFEFLRFAGFNDSSLGDRGDRQARITDDHGRTVDLKTGTLVFNGIAEFNAETISLIGTNHQRLNGVALQTGRYHTRIQFILAGRGILFFIGPHLIDVFGQDIHVTGVVISPLVQGDLDIDSGNIVRLGGNSCGTMCAIEHLGCDFRRSQEIALLQLMGGPGIMIYAAGRGWRRMLPEFTFQVVHQSSKGLVHPFLPTFHAFHHLFVIDLVFQFVQPFGFINGGRRMSPRMRRRRQNNSHSPETDQENHDRQDEPNRPIAFTVH